ncbi:DUF1428 domain-containing protein [Roseitranquillus sediminis]|uniref:DUF1428 domain-containing protein n=1 Tax=Roseitranquillus sediminis TaxID=2809051 RepID=UPI001D0C8F9E|nr:DUF1428 domain-containing protein [Roseitranquillus sediminis]MBM9594682.1 DUF1428 domain-containing protein [Roseitranquillus sediminis]
MAYVDGFLLAVPNARRDDYIRMAQDAVQHFRKHGAIAMQENWGDDVPDGEVTSFPMATKKKEDETVVFAWIIWPDKETRDAAWKAMMADPEMQAGPEMPFDGKRMMWGGFTEIVSFRAD